MGYTKDQLLDLLKESQIKFLCYDHPVVTTVEDQAKYVGHLGGGLSKNLFLKDKKHRFYVISALATTKVDLKVLSQRLGLGKGGLRMAPEEALHEILQVPLGCVTPFALTNNSARAVSLVLDQGFKAQECCFFHPLSNDVTISISASGLEKFLAVIGRTPSYVDLEATPVVGKDHPPDLADLVPSDVVIFPDQGKLVPPAQLPSINPVPVEEKPTHFIEIETGTKRPKETMEKPEKTRDPLADATDVGKFVEELLQKASAAVLSEINKQSDGQQRELGSSVLDRVRERITADLENLTIGMKNEAYTRGFLSGVQAMLHSGLKCMPFRNQKKFL